ncbi:hypothetical protein DIPPA_15770, partial [Diplonema papillatum]
MCLEGALFRPIGRELQLGKRRIVAKQEDQWRREKEAEGEWLSLLLQERQQRADAQQRETVQRQSDLADFFTRREELALALADRDQRMAEMAREQKQRREWALFRLDSSEHNTRRMLTREQEMDREGIYQIIYDDLQQREQQWQLKHEMEARIVAELYGGVRKQFYEHEEKARGAEEAAQRRAWGGLLAGANASYEHCHRPLSVERGEAGTPEWVLGMTQQRHVLLCPAATVAQREASALRCAPVQAAAVVVEVFDDYGGAVVQVEATESESWRLQPAGVLQVVDETFYLPDTDPPAAFAKTAAPDHADDDATAPSRAVRVEFTPCETGVPIPSIQLILRRLVVSFSEDGPEREVRVRIALVAGYEGGQTYEFELNFSVRTVRPLVEVAPSDRVLSYKLVNPREKLQLFADPCFANAYADLSEQREFAGGSIVLRFAGGAVARDELTIGGVQLLADGKPHSFEEQEFAVQAADDPAPPQGLPRIVPPKISPARRRSSGNRQLHSDKGTTILLLPNSAWPESRLRRFLQTLTFFTNEPVPKRPKRVMEVHVSEGTPRGALRPPPSSKVTVEVNLILAGDPTFWVLADDAAPFRIFRGSVPASSPQLQQHAAPVPALVSPAAIVQNQYGHQTFTDGHFTISTAQGESPGDSFSIVGTDELRMDGDGRLLWRGTPVARCAALEATTIQSAQLTVDFAAEGGDAAGVAPTIDSVQALLRSVAFGTTTRNSGQRVFSLELLIRDPERGAPRQPLRASLGMRLLAPAVEVPGVAHGCGVVYDELCTWKRLNVFDCLPSTQRQTLEEKGLSFFDSGVVTCEIVAGATDHDLLTLQEPPARDITITEQPQRTGLSAFAVRYDPSTTPDVRAFIAEFRPPKPGGALTINLGTAARWKAAYSRGALVVQYRGGNPENRWCAEGKQRTDAPAVRPRALRALLNCICYRSTEAQPPVLHKVVKVTVRDWLGAVSSAAFDLALTPQCNPTDLALLHTRIAYRQNSPAVRNGLPMFPRITVTDVDTTTAHPGAFISTP